MGIKMSYIIQFGWKEMLVGLIANKQLANAILVSSNSFVVSNSLPVTFSKNTGSVRIAEVMRV